MGRNNFDVLTLSIMLEAIVESCNALFSGRPTRRTLNQPFLKATAGNKWLKRLTSALGKMVSLKQATLHQKVEKVKAETN